MQGEPKERWRILCEQAAAEFDPGQLLILVSEINQILEDEEIARNNALRGHVRILSTAHEH